MKVQKQSYIPNRREDSHSGHISYRDERWQQRSHILQKREGGLGRVVICRDLIPLVQIDQYEAETTSCSHKQGSFAHSTGPLSYDHKLHFIYYYLPKSKLLFHLEFLYVVAEFIQCWKIDLYYSKISETPTYKS